jgi:hypothetical protein
LSFDGRRGKLRRPFSFSAGIGDMSNISKGYGSNEAQGIISGAAHPQQVAPTSALDGISQRLQRLRDSLGSIAIALNDLGDRTFGREPSGAGENKQERPAPEGAVAQIFDDIDNLEKMRDYLIQTFERFSALA